MLPDGLEQALGGEIFVAEESGGDGFGAPGGIKIIRERVHLKLHLRRLFGKVKFACKNLNEVGR